MDSILRKNSLSSSTNLPFREVGGSTITFIGAGKVGTSLGIYFKEAGLDVRGYFSKSSESAEKASLLTDSMAYTDLKCLINESEIIWITTPDDAIESIARQISLLEINGQITFVHASGLLTSDVLDCLKKKGHRVCSAHPLLSFSDLPKAVQALKRTCFFIEGDEDDLTEIKTIFEKTSNIHHTINKKDKPAYHAGAVVLSNYLVTLVHASNQLFQLAGINTSEIGNATNNLLESVLENLKNKTPKDALTGPIKRGDAETIKKHLEVLEQNLPELTELYKVMGKETMRMIDMPSKSSMGDFW